MARWDKILQLLKNTKFETPIKAIFLQEHNLKNPAEAKKLALEYGFHMFAVPLNSRTPKGGTAILIPKGQLETNPRESHHEALARVKSTIRALPDGRGIACDTLIHGHMRRIASVYAPADPALRVAFFTSLTNLIDSNTIMGIDANCVPDVTLDRQSTAASDYENTGATTLNDVIASLALIDVAREWLGTNPFFTCFKGQSKTRIDRVYVPDVNGLIWTHVPMQVELFPRPLTANTLDHEPAAISIKQTSQTRGKDVSHINESIFDNATFNAKIIEIINTVLQTHTTSWADTWGEIKRQCRCASIARTMEQKAERTAESLQMQLRIQALKRLIDAGESSPQEETQYVLLQTEFNTKRDHFISPTSTPEIAAFKKGSTHDQATAAFFRPYKSHDSYRWIEEIIHADWTDPSNPVPTGTRTTDPSQVPEVVTKYYESLYAAKRTVRASMDICLDTLRGGKRVTPPTAAKCGAPVTKQELTDTINLLPSGKSAGPDALPYKFYMTFCSAIAPILENVFQEAHARGTLLGDTSHGHIILLYKKGNRDDPRNYRPITLLNSDYKILMRILAMRMNEAVVQFVSKCQTGFVPDSFLPENTMLLNMIQQHLENEDDADNYLVFLDMEKAFDRCSWDFLIEALSALGFDQSFIDFVRLTYSDTAPPARSIVANGYKGPQFHLHSGVAQGCPLSPLLFLVIAEPLSRLIHQKTRNIRDNPRLPNRNSIQGVKIGKTRHRISQFADDSTLIQRKGDEHETNTCLQIWQEATAMKENEQKREGLLLGTLAKDPTRAPSGVIHGDKWSKQGESILALGHPIGHNFDQAQWWLGKYRSVKARFGLWPSMRRLSLKGRNLLLQSMIYGAFRFWLYAMVMPDEVIKYLEEDAKNVLWSSSPSLITTELGSKRARPYIKRKSAYRPETKGGAGTTHWASHCRAFYAEWVVRFLHPRKAPWKTILRAWYPDWNYLKDGIFTAPTGPLQRLIQHLPKNAHYLRRCIQEFHSLRLTQNTDLTGPTMLAESVWDNPRFDIPLPQARQDVWIEEQLVTHVSNLFDPHTDRIHDDHNWRGFFRDYSPDQPPRRMNGDLQNILAHLPHTLEADCSILPPSQMPNNAIVALVPEKGDPRYARLTHSQAGPV